MTIKIQRLYNGAIILLSWLTIPLLGSRNIKRFLPASVLIVLIEIFHARIGKKHMWWVFYNRPKSFLFGEFPFNIGPFFVLSIWVLKWTYGNFKRFIILNGLAHIFFAFPFSHFAKKIRYYSLVRFNHFQFFLYFFFKAFLLYGIQSFFENNKKISNDLEGPMKKEGRDDTVSRHISFLTLGYK